MKIWSHTMYTKDKRESFKCIPLYTWYCFLGNFTKTIRSRERMSYKKNGLTRCMNIINGGIAKRMITYNQIPGLSRSISFVRRHFQLK